MLKKIIFAIFILKITAVLGHFIGKWALALPISLGVGLLLYALVNSLSDNLTGEEEKAPITKSDNDDFLKMTADESYAIFGTAGYED